MFRTIICDLLHIEHPIIQAPMQFIATPQLVAAVAEAGGIGILAGIGQPLDVLRQQIREVRRLTEASIWSEPYPPLRYSTSSGPLHS